MYRAVIHYFDFAIVFPSCIITISLIDKAFIFQARQFDLKYIKLISCCSATVL